MPNKKQGTILIAGYYGFGNTGDEAILSTIMAELCKQREDLEFIVVSSDPAATTSTHHVRSVGWKDVERLLAAASESDLIILGGGGLFQDYWGVPKGVALTASHWGISFCSAVAMLAVLYQKPFMIYSVGVGPLHSEEGRMLTRWTFELAGAATVRDQESLALLASLGVPADKVQITPDPALNLEPDARTAAGILQTHGVDPISRPLVGVSIRNWAETEEAERWKMELAAALDEFLEGSDAHIVFIPFQVSGHPLENDHAAASIVASQMEKADRVFVLPEAHSPAVTAGLLSQCQLVVGMRLHSLILAASAGVPSVALVYDPKVQNFMESLGMSDYSLLLQSMTGKELAGILKSTWERRQQIRETLQTRTDNLKGLSKKAPSLAVELLEEKRGLPFPIQTIQSLAIQRTLELANKEQEAQSLTSSLAAERHQAMLRQEELASARWELVSARRELQEILSSKTWKLAQIFRQIRLALLPAGSRREEFVRAIFQGSRSLLYRSIRAATLIRDSLRRHGFPGAFLRGTRVLRLRLYHANKQFLNSRRFRRELDQLEAAISQHTGFFDVFHVPMGWNTALFQRFQHISLQTARMGGLALYGGHPVVDLGITVFHNPKKNLYVFDATNHLIVERVFQALRKKQQPRILRVQSIDLVTTAQDVDRFIEQGFHVVYEYIDEINPAITGAIPDVVHQRHTDLLKDERVTAVATSDLLLEDVRRHRSRNFLLSTNGVDLDHWRIEKGSPPMDLVPALNGKLVVGYHGALAKWIDYRLLRSIAEDGSYELVLIGFEHDGEFAGSGLKSHPRVHYLGSKSYFELNTYAIHYDIAILPFKNIELTQSVSPVKIFEYMAARKPVVTTDLRECRKYRSCLIGRDHPEFMQQLKRAAALKDDPLYLSLLDQEAGENSWESKTLEILRLAGVIM